MIELEDLLADLRLRFAGRTQYAGREPPVDERLVAEIDRLRAQLNETRVPTGESWQTVGPGPAAHLTLYRHWVPGGWLYAVVGPATVALSYVPNGRLP